MSQPLTDAERRAKIDILTELTDEYGKFHDMGALPNEKLAQYVSYMRELDRLTEIERCRYSVIEFSKRYLNTGRLLKPETPSPHFHYEMSEMISDELNANDRNSYLAIVAPRSHAKSVLGTVASIIYATCFGLHNNFLIISNTQEIAQQLLAMVKYELEYNDDIIRDFGAFHNRHEWSKMSIITATNVKIKAAGSGDALRGMNHLGARPWVFMDDIEKDDEVESSKYRDKVHSWLEQAVKPLGSPEPGGTKIIYVGTILHTDSVLNRVIKNDTLFKSKRFSAIIEWPKNLDLWDRWGELLVQRDFPDATSEDHAKEIATENARLFYENNREQMDEGAEVLWGQRMSLVHLMTIRQASRKAFLTEYIGDPRDETTVLFNSFHYFDFAEINAGDLTLYGAVDPSLGKNARSDLSAIVTIGVAKNGLIYVVDVDAKRRSPDKIIADVIEKSRQFNWRALAVETTQFQAFFKSELDKRSAIERAYVPTREIKPSGDKWGRIASLEPLVSNGFIRFQKFQRELLAELEDVGSNGSLPKHDDRSDALEMAVSLVRQNKRTIAFATL